MQDERGASDFEAIQSAMRSRPQRLSSMDSTCSLSTVRISATVHGAGKRPPHNPKHPGAFFDCT